MKRTKNLSFRLLVILPERELERCALEEKLFDKVLPLRKVQSLDPKIRQYMALSNYTISLYSTVQCEDDRALILKPHLPSSFHVDIH